MADIVNIIIGGGEPDDGRSCCVSLYCFSIGGYVCYETLIAG